MKILLNLPFPYFSQFPEYIICHSSRPRCSSSFCPRILSPCFNKTNYLHQPPPKKKPKPKPKHAKTQQNKTKKRSKCSKVLGTYWIVFSDSRNKWKQERQWYNKNEMQKGKEKCEQDGNKGWRCTVFCDVPWSQSTPSCNPSPFMASLALK